MHYEKSIQNPVWAAMSGTRDFRNLGVDNV